MAKYKMTGWEPRNGDLTPHSIDFEGEEIQHSGTVEKLFEIGKIMLIKTLPGTNAIESIYNITLWKEYFGRYVPVNRN